jgi:putative tryptophan/tyrosine transport system substrate-binding protein
MRLIGRAVVLTLSLLATPLMVMAQRPEAVVRLGFLSSRPRAQTQVAHPFLQGLRELGWVEGRNLTLEWRSADGRLDRLPSLAAELVGLKVDIIVSSHPAALLAAKQATTTIPIVMLATLDPVGQRVIQSLAHPGGNVTGVAVEMGPEQVGKRMEFLKAAVPRASRMAVLRLMRPGEEIYFDSYAKVFDESAKTLGVAGRRFDVQSPEGIEGAFAAMLKWRADMLYVGPGLAPYRKQVVDLAARHRLPALYLERDSVDEGGLMSYMPSYPELLRRAAVYVDKILKGAKPADLPVEQPTKFELVINLKTAKALGLTIPPSVLLQADRVIDP